MTAAHLAARTARRVTVVFTDGTSETVVSDQPLRLVVRAFNEAGHTVRLANA